MHQLWARGSTTINISLSNPQSLSSVVQTPEEGTNQKRAMGPLSSTSGKWQTQNLNPDLMKRRGTVVMFTEHPLCTRDFACILVRVHPVPCSLF